MVYVLNVVVDGEAGCCLEGSTRHFCFVFVFTNFWRKWYKGGGQIWENWKMMGLGCIM